MSMVNALNENSHFKLIEQLIEYNNGPAYLKDLESGKLLLANQENLLCFASDHMQKFDDEVVRLNRPIEKRHWMNINASGYVESYHLHKFPLCNIDNKVIAVLTLCQDLTRIMTLWDLYQAYCTFYDDKVERVKKFIEQIQAETCFIELPTHCELLVLILKESKYSNKDIAIKINVQLATIETHVNKLNQKIKDFHHAIALMSQWQHGFWEF